MNTPSPCETAGLTHGIVAENEVPSVARGSQRWRAIKTFRAVKAMSKPRYRWWGYIKAVIRILRFAKNERWKACGHLVPVWICRGWKHRRDEESAMRECHRLSKENTSSPKAVETMGGTKTVGQAVRDRPCVLETNTYA